MGDVLMTDLISSWVLLGGAGLLASSYWLKVRLAGHAHFSRLEKERGSAILSMNLMQMAFWGLQPLVRLMVRFQIHPHTISILGAILSGAASVALALGRFGVAALLNGLGSSLDAVDGMVARTTGRNSEAGVVLDSSLDRVAEFNFIAGAILFYRDSLWIQFIALLALLGSFMVSYSTAKAEAMQVTPPRGSMRRSERAVLMVLGATFAPFSIQAGWETAVFGAPVGFPLVLSLTLIAIMANFSAYTRLKGVALQAEARKNGDSREASDSLSNRTR